MVNAVGASEALNAVRGVYAAYEELVRCAAAGLGREELGGCLLLVAGPSPTAGDALVRAASIAGAASLLVEAEPAVAREMVRSGVCDFLVTNLSEGLRILKNEVRRRAAVAVCVLGEPRLVVEECVERGVQPDLLAAWEDVLVERGALVVGGAAGLGGAGWEFVWWTAPAPAARALARLDVLAAEVIGAGGLTGGFAGEGLLAWRQRWLARAPQYLGRLASGGRGVGMAVAERERFAGRVAEAVAAGELPVGVVARSMSLAGESLVGVLPG